MLHLSVGAAAIHIANHCAAAIIDIHHGIAGRGELRQRCEFMDDTTACAVDIAAVVEGNSTCWSHHLTDGAAIDVHRTGRSAGIIVCCWKRTHRGQGTTTIHVVKHMAARYLQVGVAKHAACGDAELLRVVFGIAVRAATASIHITVPAANAFKADDGALVRVGLFDGDVSIALHMAVGAAAIHAVHDRAAIHCDMGVTHVGLIHYLVHRRKGFQSVRPCPGLARTTRQTTAAAIHLAVVVAI